jgi:putative ABC transport system ATP-binding protein
MRLHISQLTFEYPRQTFTLSIPDLTVESGESLAFIGPSGCGKTTLLRLIAGIHVPQSGQLTLNSISPAQMTDAARREFRITRIGFVFQDFQLIDYLNVEENIRLPFRIHPALQ